MLKNVRDFMRDKMSEYERVFILGLDGLEYDFVERWNLKPLKQLEYGKIRVPIDEKVGVPTSPEVWASFLTGRNMFGLRFEGTPPPLAIVWQILHFVRRYVPLSLGLGRKIRENVPRRWWGGIHTGFPSLKMETFLDVTKSKKINVPYYNYDNTFFRIGHQFSQGELPLEQAISKLRALYEKRKKQILCEIEELGDADLVFAFMHFPDVLQHFLFIRRREIRKHYLDLADYVSVVKRKIKNSIFIIVSDHGFDLKTENHSKHAFYSSNIALEPKPRQITDFYNIILRLIET